MGPAQPICLAIAIGLHLAMLGLAYENTPAPLAQPLPITLSARWVGDTNAAAQLANITAQPAKPAVKKVQPAPRKKVVKKTTSNRVVKPVPYIKAPTKPAPPAINQTAQTIPAMPANEVANSSAHAGSGHPATPAGHRNQHAPTGNCAPIARAPGLHNPEPPYPYESRSRGEEGRVILKVRVNADGTASSVEVDQSSGYYRLDREARRTVSRWRFIPGKQHNVTVAAWARVTIIFQIRS